MTILKVCQDPVVGARFRLHPRHHHSALLCAHHELAEQGDSDGDGDGDGDDDGVDGGSVDDIKKRWEASREL